MIVASYNTIGAIPSTNVHASLGKRRLPPPPPPARVLPKRRLPPPPPTLGVRHLPSTTPARTAPPSVVEVVPSSSSSSGGGASSSGGAVAWPSSPSDAPPTSSAGAEDVPVRDASVSASFSLPDGAVYALMALGVGVAGFLLWKKKKGAR